MNTETNKKQSYCSAASALIASSILQIQELGTQMEKSRIATIFFPSTALFSKVAESLHDNGNNINTFMEFYIKGQITRYCCTHHNELDNTREVPQDHEADQLPKAQ